jgi:hypothetical protein
VLELVRARKRLDRVPQQAGQAGHARDRRRHRGRHLVPLLAPNEGRIDEQHRRPGRLPVGEDPKALADHQRGRRDHGRQDRGGGGVRFDELDGVARSRAIDREPR